MSLATYPEEIDAMFGVFTVRWNDGEASTLLGYQPELQYIGNTNKTAQDWTKYFGLLSYQTVLEKQTTLSCCAGDIGKRRYTTSGFIKLDLWAPKVPDGFETCRKLAIIARSAFRGKTAGASVVLSDVRIRELPDEASNYRFSVVADYHYDEIN